MFPPTTLPAGGLLLLAAAAAYALLALLARQRWRARARRVVAPPPGRPVTVLKPLCGAEPLLYENLRSYCTQDHPAYQLLFALHGPDDPARKVAERLRAEFPALDIGIVIDPRVRGINRKVSSLANLLAQARHDWLLLADSDIAAPPDLLRRVTAPLADETVGVVTCLYRGRAARGFWPRLGERFIDDWFAPSVCLARLAGSTRYAFGATIALRREVLDAAGGFAAIADEVADDWWLGEHSRRAGYRTVLSECEVATDVSETRLVDVAARELRWLRAIRAVAPLGYAFSFVCWTTPVVALGWLLAGGSMLASALAGTAIAARIAIAAEGTRSVRHLLDNAALIPLRDGLSLALWTVGLAGRAVRWRGQPMKIAAPLTRRT